MKKVFSLILALGLIASLTACGGGDDKEASGDSAKSEVKIAIICDSAGQNDNGYNQSAVNGAKKAAEELGYDNDICGYARILSLIHI